VNEISIMVSEVRKRKPQLAKEILLLLVGKRSQWPRSLRNKCGRTLTEIAG